MIIGINGIAGAGKDTAADYISNKLSYVNIAYADEIKRIAMNLYGFSYEQLWGPSERRNECSPLYPGLTARFVLQKLGTEVGRGIHKDTWVNKLFHDYENLFNSSKIYSKSLGIIFSKDNNCDVNTNPKGLVIPDVRWPEGNEGNAIRDRGGIVINVSRYGAGLSGSLSEHESEQNTINASSDIFDCIIINDGCLSDLYDKLDNALIKFNLI